VHHSRINPLTTTIDAPPYVGTSYLLHEVDYLISNRPAEFKSNKEQLLKIMLDNMLNLHVIQIQIIAC
jgi:hypothetical protein